ncbi:MAG: hypothetical protein COX48_00850 [bacterium (Candidatus Stahlbacteria) CG23_combo_of_CG06-09_8_20_14_all_34_7]|nr:MAG: hypothetical protein COX48_00850 [bacterium (Candidatus Stahlbacteria) CG23_combo_of_CG06-09_8_20_14_all_34_7]
MKITFFLIFMSVFLFAQDNQGSVPTDSTVISELSFIESFIVSDMGSDDGTALRVKWIFADHTKIKNHIRLYREIESDTARELLCDITTSTNEYIDKNLCREESYRYSLVTLDSVGAEMPGIISTDYIKPKANYFKTNKIILLLMILIYTSVIVILVETVKKGKVLFVRKISGLDTLDEAVGRATEMGRPVLYVPGSSTMSDIATIASLNILGPVAKKIAEYDTRLIVPNRDPIVMTVAKEVVKESYSEAGRPDAYTDNDVFFLTDSQFGYAAAISGIMTREKPATNLLLGMFWAESLIIAEAGNTTGAIQIAGTDAVTQLPFFITSCDYTIIGEELYAASAYLSREPLLMGTLKAQDYFKGMIIFFICIYLIFLIISTIFGGDVSFLNKILEIIKFIFKS